MSLVTHQGLQTSYSALSRDGLSDNGDCYFCFDHMDFVFHDDDGEEVSASGKKWQLSHPVELSVCVTVAQ